VFERDPGFKASLTTVGIRDHADWVARDCDLVGRVSRFTVIKRGEEVARVSILLPGYHNILNALLVLATVDELGLDVVAAARALEGFSGVRRRFDLKFRRGGITVIDDYAHHPAEIRATLASLRAAWPNGRIWCVFQPHQASRTRFLLREFAAALSAADRLLVPDIFFARDSAEERRRISSRDLVLKVLNLGAEAEYIPDFDEIEDFLLARLRPRDVLVTMGAGDIYRVAESVAKRLEGYGAKSIPA
jgi:UDP-N-acetylmuramate--alanine ligase